MTAPNEYYVRPVNGNDTTGDGLSHATAWKTVQKALDTITRDATDGDRINVNDEGDDVLSAALVFTTYGMPAFNAPLWIQGYTATAGDGGIGGISGGGSVGIVNTGTNAIQFRDMHLHNCGTVDIINPAATIDVMLLECELDNTTGDGLDLGAGGRAHVIGCNFHNIGGRGINCQGALDGVVVYGNYFKNGTNDFTKAIEVGVEGMTICRNIISLDGSSSGIVAGSTAFNGFIAHNAVLSASGTGVGIDLGSADIAFGILLANNAVEGFSGVGGIGYRLNSSRRAFPVANNVAFNNTTNYSGNEDHLHNLADWKQVLAASPFAKSGADTFANRFGYFSAADTGNVRGGAYVGG